MLTLPKRFEHCQKITIQEGQFLFIMESICREYIDDAFLLMGPTRLKPTEFLTLLGATLEKEPQSLVVLAEKMYEEWIYVAVNSYGMEH